MLTTKQKVVYLRNVVLLRKLMVLKDNPAFTYQVTNRRQAINRVHSLQDKIVEAAVDNQVYGNSDSVNHQKTVEKTISDALENDRKRIYKVDDNRYINTAVKLNAAKYSEILNNRLDIESVKLEARIEDEIRKSKYYGLSEAEIKRNLTEEFKDTAKLRTANIIRDALHTNEANISWIHALEKGFQYKVWNNGRGKGKVRAWHRARFISSVSIDEPFDIFGSYHAEMMYPGDLNGGAENVANCRCWLSYTNQKPSNYKSKGNSSSSRNTSRSKQNTGSIFSNLKNKVSSLISRSPKSTSKKDNNIKNTTKKKSSTSKKSKNNYLPKKEKNQKSKKDSIKNAFNKISDKLQSKETLVHDNIKISKKVNSTYLTFEDVIEILDSIPSSLKKTVKEIKLYNYQEFIGGQLIFGRMNPNNPTYIEIFSSGRSKEEYRNIIIHELAHILDVTYFGSGLSISESLWGDAFRLDKEYRLKLHKKMGTVEDNNFYISENANNDLYKESKSKRLSEDFADSVMKFFDPNYKNFDKEYPKRYEVLKEIFGV